MQKVFFIVPFVLSHFSDQLPCPEQAGVASRIIWPETTSCTVSNPLCLDDNWLILKRCCNNGAWEPEPNCSHIQTKINPCPEGLIYDNATRICYILSNPGPFRPKCPYPDTVSFRYYKSIITKHMAPVWMPVKRDLSNGGLGFLLWMEADIFYKVEYNETYNTTGKILGKNCLLYYNESYIVLNACDEKHPIVCAYPVITVQQHNLCGLKNCYQSDFSSSAKCFCIGSKSDSTELAEFHQPQQNLLYEILNNEPCTIGLGQVEGKPLWLRSRTPLNYSFWSTQVNFNHSDSTAVLLPDGWSFGYSSSCIIYETISDIKTPTLELIYYENLTEFIVTVTELSSVKWFTINNKSLPLINCFTDALPMSLLYKFGLLGLHIFDEGTSSSDKMNFVFKPYLGGPGHYWCEAFKYPDLEIITTDVILLPQTINVIGEFVALIRANYDKDIDPLTSATLNVFDRMLIVPLKNNRFLSQCYSSATYRFFKIVDINEENHTITFNLHFTLKVPPPLEILVNEEVSMLKGALVDALREECTETDFEILDVLSTDFCKYEVTHDFNVTLTWGASMPSDYIYPEEYCFTCNGSRLGRLCDGNFIDGQVLSEILEPCKIEDDTPVSRKIRHYLTCNCSNSKEIIEMVISIVENNLDQVGPLDVYLLGDVIEFVKNDENLDMNIFSEMIGTVIKIPQDVLIRSQTKLNATDRILSLIDEVGALSYADNSTTNGDNFTFILQQSSSNFKGVALYQNGEKIEVKVLTEYINENDLDHQKDLISMLVLDPKLFNDMNDNSEIVVTVYFNNRLFNGCNKTAANPDYMSRIFGVMITNFDKTFSGPITVYHKISPKFYDQIECSYWNYGAVPRGYWEMDHWSNFSKGFSICRYWHATHFAVLLLPSDDFTKNKQILDIVTTINCTLSLIGLFGILLTAILFKKWRVNTGNQVLTNFSLTVTLQIVLFGIAGPVYGGSRFFCIIVGFALHYAIISQFCWMFVIAILQFRRFVEVLGAPPNHVHLKACICGWGLPLIPPVCVCASDPLNYTESKVGLCYPSGLALYLGIWLPIALVIVINFVIFLYIIYSVVHKKAKRVVIGSHEVLFQWKLAIMLFFMLGLTWLFGFLAINEYEFIFSLLFCFTASLQGFIMFLFFILFNESTRNLYVVAIRRRLQKQF